MLIIRYIGLMIIFILISSCVKKQIKQDSTPLQEISQDTSISSESVTAKQIEDDEVIDETSSETDVREEREISLETVYFDFDKYELKEEAKEKLFSNAKKIIENNYYVTIEGHCDERGTEQYNLSLGQKRANVVKQYYIKLGVPENRIATISYGEERPVCFEQNEECWSKNRRAETKVGR